VKQQETDEVDVSDIELNMPETRQVDNFEDETLTELSKANFRQNEHLVGSIPFPHWTINRQMM
jgi:hypothetical protein